MALVIADDQWRPALAPIRTTAPPSSHQYSSEPAFSHGSTENTTALASSNSSSSLSSHQPRFPYSFSRPPSDSPCCTPPSNKSSYAHLLPNCFSCVQPPKTSTSPRRRRHIAPCMHRKRLYNLRSLTFLFPAAGRMHSFYSSTPTAKSQLSGTFPRTPSGKYEQYMSPRTPSATALTSQLSSKFSHFSSPRTPASSKVQHFSGAIPSPRTPYGPSVVTSPASARRKKPTFTLAMPPGMMDKKKAFEQISDEPTSPHVTCVGRVRRQTQCKKLVPSDAIDPRSHRCQATKAQQKSTSCILSSNHQPDSPLPNRNYSTNGSNVQSQKSTECSITKQPTMVAEACTQRFGKQKLVNLHKIQPHGHETSHAYNNVLFEPDRVQGQDGTISIQVELPDDDDDGDGDGDGGGGGRPAEAYPQHCLLLMRGTGSRRRLSEAHRASPLRLRADDNLTL
ncbi:hypothetical protein GOP47_0014013 [Adiantum capillus-veneris]|uniref:Uncharacterized protein n=1 Tax=Adiantum capillus-veneris TaxID=13818 RepID=A0A9D4UQ34_ADICA|nr:hypothetical protein GOP47_0014013 [Adiantum capillus-veneris]